MGNTKTTPAQNEEMAKRYLSGESSNAIAPDYNVSDVTVCNILKRMGVEMRHATDNTNHLDDDVVIKLYLSGKSTNAIGEMFGVSHRAISDRLKRNGVYIRNKKEAAEPQRRYNTCVICGKVFSARREWGKNYGRKTCSPECMHTHLRNISIDRNMTHGGSQGRYQRIARESKEQVCEECGRRDVRLDVHHIDHDKCNNNPENLRMLCVSCHARFHYFNGDVNIQGAPRKCEA